MKQPLTDYFDTITKILSTIEITNEQGSKFSLNEGADKAVDIIITAAKNSAKVMVIGNGGSAAIASHMQNDLCKMVGARGIVFYESPLLTAYSNDNGYEIAFEKSVELWAEKSDLLIAISSSGESDNILRAVDIAKIKGCNIITISGFLNNNPLRNMGDVNFYVPSKVYGYVEVTHSILVHFLTDIAAIIRSQEGVETIETTPP